MEENSFQQRFKNRAQFVALGGRILVGDNSISKEQLSRRKIHSLVVLNKSVCKLPQMNQTESNEYLVYNVNKSFSYDKLPPLQFVKKRIISEKVQKYAGNAVVKGSYAAIHNPNFNSSKEIYCKSITDSSILKRNYSFAFKNANIIK